MTATTTTTTTTPARREMSLRRIVRWVPYEGAGLEHLHINDWGDTIRVRSVIIGHKDGTDYGIHYEMTLDPDWTFRSVIFQRTDGVMKVLQSDGKGNWHDGDGEPLPQLDGCIDIDISGTPFTNTLPIRRNRDWVIGEPRRFDMAWVPLDTLEPFQGWADLHPAWGRNAGAIRRPMAPSKPRFSVDDDGLVVDYPGLFRRAQ